MVHKVNVSQLFTGIVVRPARPLWVPASIGHEGATAAWALDTDDGLARCVASQTAATFVIPLVGLHIGDTLLGVSAVGQVESAGGNVTCVLSVRKGTAAAGDIADVELDTANVGTLSADTLISSAGTPLAVTGLSEFLEEGELLYALLTATTAASTDIALAGLIATYDSRN